MEAIQINLLERLKYRANFPAPKCTSLIGVVDEDGILEQDEIFVQY
jgi:hypothetical protein